MATGPRWTRRPIVALIACILCALGATGRGATPERMRPSALAGTWYPADPAELRGMVDRFLAEARVSAPQGRIRALIVPHAGYAYSGATAGQAFSILRGQDYRRVLILAPSHRSGFRGLSIADADAFRTPLGDIPLDLEAVKVLQSSDLFRSEPQAHVLEHSIEIELPLLQRALPPGWHLIPVLVGGLEGSQYQTAADLLGPLADDGTLVVVSSDFTHYGERFDYLPFPLDARTPDRIRALDAGAIARIQAKDPQGFLDYQERTGITVCGFRAIEILLRMLGPQAQVERIAYTTSGDLTGDFENSVSYAALAVTDPQPLSAGPVASAPEVMAESPSVGAGTVQPRLDEVDLKRLHRLATLAVEDAVFGPADARDNAEREAVDALPARLKEPAGAFVTLKRHGELRGCIGYIEPREPLYLAVLANGDNAARRDPRFHPVAPAELDGLEIEVSVLTPPRPIESWQAFKVGEQGIVLSKAGRRAVFLPEVATEQGWTREETLSQLSLKAGLPANAWQEGASFEVFESTKYSAPYAAAVSMP